MTRYRKGWKYNFALIMPNGDYHTYKKTNLSEGFAWVSKVINYLKIAHEEDIVIRITKIRAVFPLNPKIVTLKGFKDFDDDVSC
jgi:hypothetical protein